MSRGILPSKNYREHLDLQENQTPSEENPVFEKIKEMQKCAEKTKNIAVTSLKKALTNENHNNNLTDPITRIKLSKEALSDHLEERVSTFLLYLIDCYDTENHYTIGKTETQTKSTPEIKVEKAKNGKPAQTVKLASAHHGVIPCVYAYPRDEWEIWKKQDDPKARGKPEPVIYMKNTDSYFANNACTGLEALFNQKDIDIDGNATEQHIEFAKNRTVSKEKLREYSIGLLNQVAKKELEPIGAFVLFLKKFSSIISELKTNSKNREDFLVFSYWEEDIKNLESQCNADPSLFVAKLLSLNFSQSDSECLNLSTLLLPRHFELIKTKNIYQNQISTKIEAVSGQILKDVNRKPNNFSLAMKITILEKAKAESDIVKSLFFRYYCASEKSLTDWKRKCTNPALQLIHKQTNINLINSIFKDFREYIHNLAIAEAKYQCHILHEARKLKKLSFSEFFNLYNKTYPKEEKLNHQKLYRIENGGVKMSKEQIKRFANILDIPEMVFYPQFCQLS